MSMPTGVLLRIFGQAQYGALFVIVALLVWSAAILLPNSAIVSQVLLSESFGVRQSVAFLWSLLTSFGTSATPFTGVLTLVITLLCALNVVLMTYYIRRRQYQFRDRHVKAAGLAGVMSAVLGIGCAACGSVILTAIFGLVGGVGVLALLPLHGAEFGLIGLVLLLWTAVYLMRRIADPLVCPLVVQDPRP